MYHTILSLRLLYYFILYLLFIHFHHTYYILVSHHHPTLPPSPPSKPAPPGLDPPCTDLIHSDIAGSIPGIAEEVWCSARSLVGNLCTRYMGGDQTSVSMVLLDGCVQSTYEDWGCRASPSQPHHYLIAHLPFSIPPPLYLSPSSRLSPKHKTYPEPPNHSPNPWNDPPPSIHHSPCSPDYPTRKG